MHITLTHKLKVEAQGIQANQNSTELLQKQKSFLIFKVFNFLRFKFSFGKFPNPYT